MKDVIIIIAVVLFCAALITLTWYLEGTRVAIITALAGLTGAIIAPVIVRWIRGWNKKE